MDSNTNPYTRLPHDWNTRPNALHSELIVYEQEQLANLNRLLDEMYIGETWLDHDPRQPVWLTYPQSPTRNISRTPSTHAQSCHRYDFSLDERYTKPIITTTRSLGATITGLKTCLEHKSKTKFWLRKLHGTNGTHQLQPIHQIPYHQ